MSNRMPGHELRAEGAPFSSKGYRIMQGGFQGGVGHAKCSCGDLSPVLTSATKRKAWHRDHKEELRKESRK